MNTQLKKYYLEIREENSELYETTDLVRNNIFNRASNPAEEFRWGHPVYTVSGTYAFYLQYQGTHIEFGIFNADLYDDVPEIGIDGPGDVRYIPLSSREKATRNDVPAAIQSTIAAIETRKEKQRVRG